MLKDKKGNRLFRRVDVKIVYPNEVFPVQKISKRAEPKKGFGSDGVDDILMQIADELETKFPWWEFELVELAPNGKTASYVFKFHSYRPQSPSSAVLVGKPEDDVVPYGKGN